MATGEETKRRVPLWVKVLLGLSLALNLAVVGLVAGTIMRIGGAPGGPGAANYAIPYVLALPREDRREVWKTVRDETRAGRLPSRKDRRARYVEMIAVLSAEEWQPEAARAIMTQQGDETSAVQAAAQNAWIDQISEYTQAERQAYAAHLEDVINRRRKKKR